MYYAVIGVQEDVDTSLCVMEHYLPLFFKRALQTYRSMAMIQLDQTKENTSSTQKSLYANYTSELSEHVPTIHLEFTKNKTPHKQKISSEAREILAKNMTLEYEFYEFVKQRLKLQVEFLKRKLFPINGCFNRRIYIHEKVNYSNRH